MVSTLTAPQLTMHDQHNSSNEGGLEKRSFERAVSFSRAEKIFQIIINRKKDKHYSANCEIEDTI
ncbi:MAG: hypothetical protein R3Y58_09250 [Eubacteriales bacterium]